MLSRLIHRCWLLSCLIALLALGMQPLCAVTIAVAEHCAEESSPVEDPAEDEQESLSDEGAPLRRRNCAYPPTPLQFAATMGVSAQRPHATLRTAPPHSRGEMDARNGLGGPLRL
jgi:hypothetical protein